MNTIKSHDKVTRRDIMILAATAVAATPLAVLAGEARPGEVDPAIAAVAAFHAADVAGRAASERAVEMESRALAAIPGFPGQISDPATNALAYCHWREVNREAVDRALDAPEVVAAYESDNAAARVFGTAYERVLATPATTMAGVAAKLGVALTFAAFDLSRPLKELDCWQQAVVVAYRDAVAASGYAALGDDQ